MDVVWKCQVQILFQTPVNFQGWCAQVTRGEHENPSCRDRCALLALCSPLPSPSPGPAPLWLRSSGLYFCLLCLSLHIRHNIVPSSLKELCSTTSLIMEKEIKISFLSDTHGFYVSICSKIYKETAMGEKHSSFWGRGRFHRLQAIGIDYIFPPVVIEGWGLGWGLKTVFMKGRIQALEGKILGQGAHRHQRGNTQGLAFSVCLGLALSIFDLCNNLGGFVLSFLKSAVNFFFREKNMVEWHVSDHKSPPTSILINWKNLTFSFLYIFSRLVLNFWRIMILLCPWNTFGKTK